ncbi:hypothetical protein OPT61_g6115 [Boeremia exigua]|uniref:Uncharacterized protein n=1 Tax=Boeremia exigua TaxID=749465 RepID=A0ACC2I7V3_9PLEO|nr:hypothetical protein OPT61_g6115 [Boeremia exigua]
MVKLHMGIWAAIAAGGIMFLLIVLPLVGCMFSRSKKAKKAAELEELAAEKGEVVHSVPASAPAPAAPAPTRPANAILQKHKHVPELSESGVDSCAAVTTKELDVESASHAADVGKTITLRVYGWAKDEQNSNNGEEQLKTPQEEDIFGLVNLSSNGKTHPYIGTIITIRHRRYYANSDPEPG